MVSGGDVHTALLLTCMGACGTALGGLIVVAQVSPVASVPLIGGDDSSKHIRHAMLQENMTHESTRCSLVTTSCAGAVQPDMSYQKLGLLQASVEFRLAVVNREAPA